MCRFNFYYSTLFMCLWYYKYVSGSSSRMRCSDWDDSTVVCPAPAEPCCGLEQCGPWSRLCWNQSILLGATLISPDNVWYVEELRLEQTVSQECNLWRHMSQCLWSVTRVGETSADHTPTITTWPQHCPPCHVSDGVSPPATLHYLLSVVSLHSHSDQDPSYCE